MLSMCMDSLGQNKRKEWSGKTKDIESLKSILEKQVKDGDFPLTVMQSIQQKQYLML